MSGAVSPERPYGELITTTLRVMTWNVWGRFGPWHEREAALIRTLEHREFPASAPERSGGSALFGRIAGSGSWGGRCPSLARYVTRVGPMDGTTAAGGRSCCLSSKDPTLTEARSLGNRTPWNI